MVNVLLIEPPPVGLYGNLRSKGTFGGTKVSSILWPPTDLMAVSGCLEKNNISTHILDLGISNLSLDEIKCIIKRENPSLIVINTSTTTIYSDLSMVRIAKELNKDIITSAIGVHVKALPKETLELEKSLDIVVNGEPEIPILNLVKNDYKPYKVRGLTYRRGRKIIKNPNAPMIKNLDELGFLSHDKVPIKKYRDPFMRRRPFTMTMATRGCINECTFCSMPIYGGLYRKRSVDHVIKELKWLTEDLGVKEVRFYENGLTYDKKWITELCNRIIKEKIDLTWICNGTRAGNISDDVIKLMKKAGCHTICIGAESADRIILDRSRKNITPDMVRRAVRIIKNNGLNVVCFFMLGLPGETKETIKKTIKFAKEINPSGVTFNIATPHPGTIFYDYLKKNNYLKTSDWSKYNSTGYPVYEYPGLTSDELYNSMFRAYRSFYLRPRYIVGRILGIRSKTELLNNFNSFISVIESFVFKKSA